MLKDEVRVNVVRRSSSEAAREALSWLTILPCLLVLACATTSGGQKPYSFLTLGVVRVASRELRCEADHVTVFDTFDRLWARGCGRELDPGALEKLADDHERSTLHRNLWPANDLYGPFGFKDERITRPKYADGTPIPVNPEAEPFPEKFTVRARCVLRTDGTLRQCYVLARTVEVAEAFGEAIPSQRFKPAQVHGRTVSTAYSFATTITREPARRRQGDPGRAKPPAQPAHASGEATAD